MISAHMAGLRTDDEFFTFLRENKSNTVRSWRLGWGAWEQVYSSLCSWREAASMHFVW